MIYLVLLSGGSGTRLWPLSNDARSKQFLKVLRDADGKSVSMVQRVFDQIKQVSADVKVVIATCASQESSIESQITGGYELVLEPERRDTAPAIMLACSYISDKQRACSQDTVIIMPIDTFADQAYYDRLVDLDAAVQQNVADIVLLGVQPTYPSEKYGYIVPASREGVAWPVAFFREKPSECDAQQLIDQGALWNCGVFAFRVEYLNDVISEYHVSGSFDSLRRDYSRLPKSSFDYEVVEKAESVAVIPYTGCWKDLGTWNTLTEEMRDSVAGLVVFDALTCPGTHVVNETGLPMVVSGIRDSVVIASPDGILVSSKERSAHVKGLVAEACSSRPMYERRRWGEYRVLDSSTYPDGTRSLVKELIIDEGKQLSYQRHRRRSEVWTIVSGSGEVVIDGKVMPVDSGQVVKIDADTMHSVKASGSMRIIEVQLGDQLIEEDIERFGNFWRREND